MVQIPCLHVLSFSHRPTAAAMHAANTMIGCCAVNHDCAEPTCELVRQRIIPSFSSSQQQQQLLPPGLSSLLIEEASSAASTGAFPYNP